VAQGYSGTDIWAGGRTSAIDSQTAASIATDATGKLTLAILTTAGMIAPVLSVSGDALAACTVSPAGPVHTYLSGTGTLNPTNPYNANGTGGPPPQFDSGGDALLKATTSDGQPLAPSLDRTLAGPAAQAIQTAAAVGLGTAPTDVAGYGGSFRPGAARFEVFATPEALAARRTARAASFWSEVGAFFGDLWEAIKNGAIQVYDWAVDLGAKILSFTIRIGEDIEKGVELAIDGLEQAAAFIAGVFNAIAADVEEAIDWLKALFDFPAIWRTKVAIETALTQGTTWMQQVVTLAQSTASGWSSSQASAVNSYFQSREAAYGPSDSMNGLSGWQPPGQPPSTTPAVGSASPNDMTNNVHHNWLQDKVSAYAPSAPGVPVAGTSLDTLFDNLAGVALPNRSNDNAAADFVTALHGFMEAIATVINDPSSFGSFGMVALLQAVQALIDGVLALCDELLHELLALLAGVIDSTASVLTTALTELGVLGELYDWIAAQGGDTSGTPPTVAGLLALIMAFPGTVIYKLAFGVGNEPFPPAQSDAAAIGWTSSSILCQELGGILQILYVVPTLIGDAFGPSTETWVSYLSLGKAAACIAIFFLVHGVPDLGAIAWGAGAAVVVPSLVMIARAVGAQLEAARAKYGAQAVANDMNDVLCVVFTLYGAAMFILGIVETEVGDLGGAEITKNLLLPLPSLFSLFSLSAFRDDPLAPWFIGTQLVADLVGYVGGGLAEVIVAEAGTDDAMAEVAS
jgi:hypothetical protein